MGRLSFLLDNEGSVCILSRMISLLTKTKKQILKLKGDIAELVQFGFEKIVPTDGCSTPYIMVNKAEGIVVKRSYLLGNRPDFAIHTLEVKDFPLTDSKEFKLPFRPDGSFDSILIQPLADISNEAKDDAIDLLCDIQRRGKIKVKSCDLAKRNVGMFQGKPVVFDW